MDGQVQSAGGANRKFKIIVALVSGLVFLVFVGVIILLAVMMDSGTQTQKESAELSERKTVPPITVKYIPPVRCQFPMTYKGRTYNDCATVDSVYPWCQYGGDKFYCPAATTPKGVCSIPFRYKGKMYNRCINHNDKYFWCALTPVFKPGMWAKCDPAMVASNNCVVPFNYKGRQYWTCTNADADFYWCSYTKDYIGGWDHCYPPHIEPDPSCVFPFTYKGRENHNCINKDADKGYYWCSRKTDSVSDWVYCANVFAYPGPGCVFPFTYKSNVYHNCVLGLIRGRGYKYWCSTSLVYDGGWAFCFELDDFFRM